MSLDTGPKPRTLPWELAVAAAPEKWDDWVELDPTAWQTRVEKHYSLIPTICFNKYVVMNVMNSSHVLAQA